MRKRRREQPQETTLEVNGVTFTHGQNDRQEYYEHTDARRWKWILLRNLRGQEPTIWTAHLIAHGRNGGQRALDTTTRTGTKFEKDPLADVNKYDHRAMLEGIAGLVKIGKWPETITIETAAA